MVHLRKWVTRIAIAIIVASLLGLVALGFLIFFAPDILPPHPYHPWALYYRKAGLPVNPYLPLPKDRAFTLEVWEEEWPVRRSKEVSFAESVQESVALFQRAYPQVIVDYKLFPYGEDLPTKVKEAIARRSPPDIYIGPFDAGAVDRDRSVMLTAFFGAGIRLQYDPLALEHTVMYGHIQAWPIWLEVPGLLVNATLLGNAGADTRRILVSGWTWDEFLALLKKVSFPRRPGSDQPGIYGLVLDDSSPDYFNCLWSTMYATPMVSADGKPGWDLQKLTRVAEFLAALRDGGIVPEERPMAGHMLDLYWNGRAAAIGPVWSGLARHVRERPQKMRGRVKPMLLPLPRSGVGAGPPPVRVYAALIYKQDQDGWEYRARLAVELVEHLISTNTTWLMAKLGVIPVFLPGRPDWQQAASLSYEQNAFIAGSTKMDSSGKDRSARTGPSPALLDMVLREVVAPALERFWSSRISPQEFAVHVDREGRRVLE